MSRVVTLGTRGNHPSREELWTKLTPLEVDPKTYKFWTKFKPPPLDEDHKTLTIFERNSHLPLEEDHKTLTNQKFIPPNLKK